MVALGCERVLTSGGCVTAREGATAIASLVEQAAGRIRIMAGGGIRPEGVAWVAAHSRADEFHASARIRRGSAMRWRAPGVDGLAAEREESDPAAVAQLAAQLRAR